MFQVDFLTKVYLGHDLSVLYATIFQMERRSKLLIVTCYYSTVICVLKAMSNLCSSFILL